MRLFLESSSALLTSAGSLKVMIACLVVPDSRFLSTTLTSLTTHPPFLYSLASSSLTSASAGRSGRLRTTTVHCLSNSVCGRKLPVGPRAFPPPARRSGEGDLLEAELEERELELELEREAEPECWLSEPESLDLLFLALAAFCFLLCCAALPGWGAGVGLPARAGRGSGLSGAAEYWPSLPAGRPSFHP